MNEKLLTGAISVLTGLAGMMGAPIDDLTQGTETGHNHESHSHQENHSASSNQLEFGSSHEHALFFLNVNGSEEEFTDRKYQVRSKYAHVENFKPHIVHKHSENVTWSYFLDTLDVDVDENCVKFKESEQCGNVSIVLNGEELDSLDKEIEQDDNLAIITPSERGKREEYMEKKLPEDYRKEVRGRTI